MANRQFILNPHSRECFYAHRDASVSGAELFDGFTTLKHKLHAVAFIIGTKPKRLKSC